MPIVDETDFEPAPQSQYDNTPLPQSSVYAAAKAGFLRSPAGEILGAAVSQESYDQAGAFDPDYVPTDHIQGYEQHAKYLGLAQNAVEMSLRKAHIDQDNATQQTIALAGPGGKAAAVGASFIDPVNLALMAVPVAGGIRMVAAGKTVSGMARTGAEIGGLTAVEESVLHGIDPDRPTMESVYGVAGAAVTGGLLGFGAGKYMGTKFARLQRLVEEEAIGRVVTTSKGTPRLTDHATALADIKTDATQRGTPESLATLTKIHDWEAQGHSKQSIVQAIDEGTTPDKVVPDDMSDIHAHEAKVGAVLNAHLGSVGAMAADDSLTLVGGPITRFVARLPIGRIAQATVGEAQRLGLGLMENSWRFLSKRTGLPEAPPIAAETRLKYWVSGQMGKARRELDDAFAKHKKRMKDEGGQVIDKQQFRQVAGNAARFGGDHPDPEIAQAARAFRKHIFEPLFHQGVHARLFDPYVKAMAHAESADPYRMFRGQRQTAHKELRAAYKQASRDARRALRSGRTAGMRGLAAAERDQLAATERAYGWHEQKLQDQAAIKLAEEFDKIDEADKAARATTKRSVTEEFEAKIAANKAAKDAHRAAITAMYGVFKRSGTLKMSVLDARIAELKDNAREALAARLKSVDFTDTVTRQAVRRDIERQLRTDIRAVNKERATAEKGVSSQSRRERGELTKLWRQKDRELSQQLDTDLSDLAAGFKDPTHAEFSNAVMRAIVKDTEPAMFSPLMREVADAVRAKLYDPNVAAPYLTRVFDQAGISADNGAGLKAALIKHYVGEGLAPDKAKDLATGSVNNIRGFGHKVVAGFGHHGVGQAGPQLERVLAVPDSVIEPWLLSDIDSIALSYARSIGGRLEVARTSADFGEPGAWRLNGDLEGIRDKYNALINAAPTPAAANKLAAEARQMEMDLRAAQERLLGVYDLPKDPTAWTTRAAYFLKAFNFMAKMPMIVPASLADVAGPVVALGLARSYGKVLGELGKGTLREALAMSTRNLQKFGTANDLVIPLTSQLAHDIEDVAPATRAMRKTQQATHVVSHLYGAPLWNVGMKALHGLMIQDEVLRLVGQLAPKMGGKLTARETQQLSDLTRYGIHSTMIKRIANMPTVDHGGLRLTDVESWADKEAVEAYRAAITKTVDTTLVTPGIGDKPTFIKGPWLGLMAQFKSYTLAAHNRVLIPTMQDPSRARALSGALAMTGGGALSYVVKMVLSGRSAELQKQIDDKDYYGFTRQAVANGGLLTVLSSMESGTAGSLGFQGTGRYPIDNVFDLVGGPSMGTGKDLSSILKALGPNQQVTGNTVHKVRNMVPLSNTIGLRNLVDVGEDAMVDELGLKPRTKR